MQRRDHLRGGHAERRRGKGSSFAWATVARPAPKMVRSQKPLKGMLVVATQAQPVSRMSRCGASYTGHPGYGQNYCCTVCGHLNVDAVAELAEQQFLQYMAVNHPEMQTPTVDNNLIGEAYVRGGYVTNHSYAEVVGRASEAGELFIDTMAPGKYLEKFNIVVVDNGTQYDSYFYYQVRRS